MGYCIYSYITLLFTNLLIEDNQSTEVMLGVEIFEMTVININIVMIKQNNVTLENALFAFFGHFVSFYHETNQ